MTYEEKINIDDAVQMIARSLDYPCAERQDTQNVI